MSKSHFTGATGVLVIGFALAIVPSCKESKNPVAPSSTTPHVVNDCPDPVQYHSASCPDRTSVTVAILARATVNGADAPWSYTFAGLTLSGSTQEWKVVEGLSIGDYEVTGQFQQQISFQVSPMSAPRVSGIFKPNSIISLEGPLLNPQNASCLTLNYVIPAGGARPQTFRFKFSLIEGTTFQNPC